MAANASAGASSAPSGRRASWDVLRVGFVLLVVLYHATFIGPMIHGDLVPRKLVFAHQVGASLLLVLSAYFVAATVRRRGTGRWWWGKIARLVPPFLVATVLAWTALRVFSPGGPGWYYPSKRALVANLLMLWNWDGTRWPFVDGSHWTIPLQLMAFTVAALIWRMPLGRGVGLRVLMWVAVLGPLVQWPYRVVQPAGSVYAVLADGFGLHRWHLFVAGVAIWMYSTGRVGGRHFAALLSTCLVAHAVHTSWFGPGGWDTDRTAVVWIGLGMLAMLVAAAGPDWPLPRRTHRAVTWLAGISYGVFLTHQTVGYVVVRRLQELGVGPTLQTGSMVLTAVVLGWALTRLVERPLHRRLMAIWDAVTGGVRPGDRPAPTATPQVLASVPALTISAPDPLAGAAPEVSSSRS